MLLSPSTASSMSSVILLQPWGIAVASSFLCVVAISGLFFGGCGLRVNQFSYQATPSPSIPGFCVAAVMLRVHRRIPETKELMLCLLQCDLLIVMSLLGQRSFDECHTLEVSSCRSDVILGAKIVFHFNF
jgi:hypothetical protein